MCGIAGKLVFEPAGRVERSEIQAMLRTMVHRGPDGDGIRLEANVGLGHLRLSIIDLNTGAQPMANEDETVWIVFNGEIYNYKLLRERLLKSGHVFRSHSDTEVIIHLYEEMGADCVRELRGMFAFAIWDSKRRSLFIARDRLGIKPLYYCQTSRAFLFASEMKALLADAAVPREIDLPALREGLSFYYLPGEDTLFRSIRKLRPGYSLTARGSELTVRQYWDLRFTQERWNMPFEQAVDELHDLLGETVENHMIADVPVGILLSGGVDSSAILSFAVRGAEKRIKTFTIGFEGTHVVDERPYARLAAEKFNAEHHEITISKDDFWRFLPAYAWHMEEPVCQPPAVALYYVSKLARQHVKVLLSGEGGDEAFAGYPNYPNMMRLQRFANAAGPLARPIGSVLSLAGRLLGDERVERYAEAMGRPLSTQYFSRSSGPTAFFNRHAGSFFSPDFLQATASASPAALIAGLAESVKGETLLNQMLYLDTKTWLPDDLLVKADKITMANSLELRVPLLDHLVLEFAASLPPEFKVRGRDTKRLLKEAFLSELPPAVIRRKKAGFPVPYERWIFNDLKPQVEDTLLSGKAVSRGYFKKREVARLLQANAGTGKYSQEVFSLLNLEFWHRAFLDGAPAAGEKEGAAPADDQGTLCAAG